MSVHVQLFHSGTKPVFDLGKSIIMQEPMFCVCGFSAHSGNKLAKHIGTHGCKSAYPNLEEAIKARVAGGGESQAATNDDKVGSSLDQELEKGLDPRISITEAHKSSEKALLEPLQVRQLRKLLVHLHSWDSRGKEVGK